MSRTTILLADDADLLRGLEKFFFRRKSFRLLVARRGEEVWNLVEKEEPDLVFLDLDMPGLAGDLCCLQLKNDPRFQATPVVLLSSAEPQNLRRCRNAAADHVLLRPIQRLRLMALMPRLLTIPARRTARREASLRIGFGPAPEDFQAARTLNLGTGGALVQTARPLPVETPMLLEISLPGNWPPIRCRGRVAWLNTADWSDPARGGEMGVEFLGLTPAEKEAIQRYLEVESLRDPA